MINISYHDSVKDVQAQFDWHTSSQPPQSAPFHRPEWFALVEQTGLEQTGLEQTGVEQTGVEPLYACAKRSGENAVMPLSQMGGRVFSLRNWYTFTWRPYAPDNPAGGAMIAAISKALKSRAHRVTLDPVPNEDGTADLIANAFSDAGWRVEVSQCDANHVINLHGQTFAQYWQTRPGPLRTTVKRKAKKVTTRILTSFETKAWDEYERIYSASWKPEEDHPAMLRAFAEAEGKAGRLRIGLALYNDAPIAAQFWTVENGCAYIHKLAHLDKYRNLSAGTTLSAAMFEHVIDRDKVRMIDFGTGDDQYKADWMGEIRPRYRIDCLNMKRAAAWADLAKLAVNRLRDTDVPMLAPRPWAG